MSQPTGSEAMRLKRYAEERYGKPFDEIDWRAVHREIAEQAEALNRWAMETLAVAPLDPCPSCGSRRVTPNAIPAQLVVLLYCAQCHQCVGVREVGT